jgi:hypothetical protein
MLRKANRGTMLAVCVLSLIAAMPMPLAGQATSPQPAWKSRITLPDEPLRVVGSSANDPDWIKFTILLDPCDVATVYFQDSNRYTFHYHFATEQLAPFAGMTPQEFDRVSLYEQGQRAVLGAVILPPTGGSPGSSPPLEYGIQLLHERAGRSFLQHRSFEHHC